MLKIYHNPNCSKSHQAITILENSNTDFARILKLFYMQIYRQKLIGHMMMYTELLKKQEAIFTLYYAPAIQSVNKKA